MQLSVVAGSRLWLEGKTTLHGYKAEARRFDVVLELSEGPAGDLQALIQDGRLTRGEVSVPVDRLHSIEPGFDDALQKAMDSRKHPQVHCRLDSYEIASSPGQPLTLRLAGRLAIAGVERPLSLNASLTPAGTGLRAQGSADLLMTDFGIKPPTLMFGVIKTDERVTVHFDLSLVPAPRAS